MPEWKGYAESASPHLWSYVPCGCDLVLGGTKLALMSVLLTFVDLSPHVHMRHLGAGNMPMLHVGHVGKRPQDENDLAQH